MTRASAAQLAPTPSACVCELSARRLRLARAPPRRRPTPRSSVRRDPPRRLRPLPAEHPRHHPLHPSEQHRRVAGRVLRHARRRVRAYRAAAVQPVISHPHADAAACDAGSVARPRSSPRSRSRRSRPTARSRAAGRTTSSRARSAPNLAAPSACASTWARRSPPRCTF